MGRRKTSRQRLFQPARRPAAGARWLLWCLLSLLLVLGWVGTPTERRPRLAALAELVPDELRERVRRVAQRARRALGRDEVAPGSSAVAADTPPPEQWLDPAALDGTWLDAFDPRWSEELHALLADTAPFHVSALAEEELADVLGDLRDRIEGLSFVRAVPVCAVGSAAASGGFAWDDSQVPVLELELELRTPVACVPVGHNFYGVDREGVLLSGSWPVPLQWNDVPLPVIGPIEDGQALFALARPGDWLLESEHTDALDVALSLAEHVDPGVRRELGPIVIDARAAHSATVANGGIELYLGGRRLIVFGRSPRTDEPGELAVERKWDAVERVVAARWRDWEVLDVRWDQPELLLSGPELASLGLGASPVGPSGRPF